MPSHTPILLAVVAAIASWVVGFGVFHLLGFIGVIDHPNDRSSHLIPTVRGGGISIMAGMFIAAACVSRQFEDGPLLLISFAGLGLAVVSFIDDLRTVGVVQRLGCQLLAAVVAIYALRVSSIEVALSESSSVQVPFLLSVGVGVLWITGYTNAFNFMDGINGLAGGQALVTSLGTAVLVGIQLQSLQAAPVLVSLCLAGASLGFLQHNFPKADMFMGDVGSAPIGYLLAVLTLWSALIVGWWMLIPLALLHANFVLDSGITFIRRVLHGDRWYEAHREHFYQRLLRSGRSHTFVTFLEIALQVVVFGLMVIYLSATDFARILLILGTIGIWLAFFAYCEVCFRRSQPLRANGGVRVES